MGFIGQGLGGLLGNIGSKILPIPGVNGGQLGSFLGNMMPFKKGGKLKKAKAKPKAKVKAKAKSKSRKRK